MSKNKWSDDDEFFDWEEVERATRNFKGSVEEIEDLLIDEVRPSRKKRKMLDRFHDEEF